MDHSAPRHIRLTSHPGTVGRGAIPLCWGAPGAAERGPVVASPAEPRYRNAVGSYSGAYAVYRALAVATRAWARDHRPDFTDTAPATLIGPHPQWGDPAKIVSFDPWGHLVGEVFAEHIRAGIDIRPTIAVTRARITTPELRPLLADGTLRPDGEVLLDNGEIRVIKAAIDSVWHLPGLAGRFGVAQADLRRTLFEETGGMFPELVTRPDIEVLLPPIGGLTVYFFGAVERIADASTVKACRVAPLSRPRDRGLRRDRPAGRRRDHRLQPQRGAGARRGYQIPRLQRPQAPIGRRSRRNLIPPHRMRRRRAGHAVPGANARRFPLARHPPDRPLGVDVEPQT